MGCPGAYTTAPLAFTALSPTVSPTDTMGPALRNESTWVMHARQLVQCFLWLLQLHSRPLLAKQIPRVSFCSKTYILLKLSAAEKRLQGNSAC